MINAAIIGVSGFGDFHYRDLMGQVEEGHMRALCAVVINRDEEEEKCARLESMGCKIFTDYKEMLGEFNGQIDLCFIPTGIHMHAPMSIDAMKAGANVFVEKPVAATVQEVNAMKAAEKETGKFVAVGYQTMYASETMIMKDAIVSGKLGKIHSVKYWGLWPRTDSYYARNGWAGHLKVGDTWVLDSPYNNALAHQLNMICFLGGSEREKSAKLKCVNAELYRAHDIESADTACIRATTEDGPVLHCIVTHCSEAQAGPEIVVRGEKGEISWTCNRLLITANGKTEEFECDNGEPLRKRIMAALRGRINGEGSFICDLDIAGTQTLMINGAHESSAVSKIPEKLVTTCPTQDSVKTVVAGLDEQVMQAFNEEKQFSELGMEWAVPGLEINVENYSGFKSCREK